VTGVRSTRYEGGPYDGRVMLGRLRPDPAQLSDDVGSSGPVEYAMPFAGGTYRRATPDGATQDVYRWQADAEPGAAA
jgi:hypothetical protein